MRLAEAHPGCRRSWTVGRRVEDGVLLGYGRLPGSTPEPLLDELRAREVYELPLDRHIRLRRRLWREFVAEAARLDVVHVFECCLIQNPVTVTALRDDAPEELVHSFVAGLVDDAAELDPLVVYLDQTDVDACFERIVRERPREWHDFFVGYYTGRGLGLAMGATGDAGTVRVLRRRAELEQRLLGRIGATVEHVDTSVRDLAASRTALAGVVDRAFGPGGGLLAGQGVSSTLPT